MLTENGANAEVVLYLENPPSKKELKVILNKLGMKASQLVRKGEKIYKENFKGKTLSEAEWLDILVQYPKLIERPIVVKGDQAVIGRPPERVIELLNS